MQTVISNFRVSPDSVAATSIYGVLPDRWYSSPKSPKFDELLSKHHAFQQQEYDLKSSTQMADEDKANNILVL